MRTHTDSTAARGGSVNTEVRVRGGRRSLTFAPVAGAVRRGTGRFLRAMLAVSLLASSTPAAPRVLADAATEWKAGASTWWRTSSLAAGLGSLFTAAVAPSPKRQEKQSDRDARVRQVKVYPGDVTVGLYERIAFSAVALDGEDNPVNGTVFTWSATDEGRGGHATRISPRGEFEATVPGTYKVTADTGGKKDHVTVTVLDGERRKSGVQPSQAPAISSRDRATGISAVKKPARQRARRSGGAMFINASMVTPAPAAAAPAPLLPNCDDYQWNGCNYTEIEDPDNRRGNPPGAPSDQGAGNGNFQIGAPVLSLSGRGLSVTLGLAYNSRVWTKNGTKINYDIDQDWPAAGWSLGFGRVVGLGSDKGGMIVDPDGTRHGFAGPAPQVYSWGSFATLHTTDGSFIDYTTQANSAGTITYAQVKHPNGTTVQYGAPGAGAVYPTSITDANGNFITVTYVNNAGPRIQTINDTLGRVINFYYDANNLLTSVVGPGLNGGTRTLLRLHYRELSTLSASFSGLTPMVRDYTPWALDAIYYPSTSTGYWFGDADSYSSYGMIQKVVEQRGMSLSASSLNEQGTVGQGTMSRQRVYDFQLSNLTDAPTFTTLTESYDGMDTAAAVTSFQVFSNSTPRTVTVTMPDGTQSVQYSYNHPGTYDDGLVYREETKDSVGNILRSSDVVWQQGSYESARPVSTTATNERGEKSGSEFSYGSSYNQVTESRDYDYGYTYQGSSNVLLRRTVTQYHTAAGYTNNHIFNLPTVVETYNGAGVRASRTEYQYDAATPPSTPNGAASLANPPTFVAHHDDAYNPFAPEYLVQECNMWDNDQINCLQWNERWMSNYIPATDYRGNVTQVTSYSNAASEPATGAITETRGYDTNGNMITASSSCCQLTTIEYTEDTQYAYPSSKTRGSSTDPLKRLKTSATYDFNTGFSLGSTDVNGRVSSTSYYAETMRPHVLTFPTGAHTDYEYDESAMTVTETSYLAPSPADTGAVAAKNIKYLNGAGGISQEKSLGPGGVWDLVDTQYDQMGRVWKQTSPYRQGDTPAQTTITYDALGREKRVEGSDGSATEAFFDDLDSNHPRPNAASSTPGNTTLVVDPWGKERWGRSDALGRLVEVVEPNPNGSGSVTTGGWATTYAYDVLGQLTGTNQGGQVRAFAYDSLGRLVRQKLAETSATLNDSGVYVGLGGAGAHWSDAYTYDENSNLTKRVDARGVVTNFDYNDPLNRLLSVSYDLTGSHENLANSPIASAPSVSYTYRTKSSATHAIDITQFDTLTATGTSGVVSTESYLYDTEGRVGAHTLTANGRPGMRTDYVYDSLDRVKDIIYPAQNLAAGTGRKTVHQDYDTAGRPTGLKVDGVDYASQLQYNAASQTTSLKVGAAGAYQVTESYNYDSVTGLLSNQKATRVSGGSTVTMLDLSYDYLRPGTTTGRTGQLTKITNNLDSQKGRAYSYDALGRLTQATGGDPASTPAWTQSYSYDRWGNRTGVTATGFTAKLENMGGTQQREQVAANHAPPLPELARGNDKRPVSDAPDTQLYGAPRAAAAYALPGSPSNLRVTQTSTAQVTINWDAPSGAVDHYRVERKGAAGQYTFVANVAGTSSTYADTGVTGGAAYLYRVRAVDVGGGNSAYSNVALGTAFTFEDDPLITLAEDPTGATLTKVKATHITQLRAAVNAVRDLVPGLGAATWTHPTLTPNVTVITADDVRDLRTALGEALTALVLSTPSYTDPTINNGQGGQWTAIKRDHIKELRLAATRGSGAGTTTGGTPVPADGLDGLTYDSASNRINTSGWEYDAAGNQTRTRSASGGWQRYEYDAGGRLARVMSDDRQTVIASYTYGVSSERLVTNEGGWRTYYAGGGSGVTAEYTEAPNSTQPQWSKSYVYLGARLLSVITPNGGGGEYVEYYHPDRLGTRLVSNSSNAYVQEQTTLPFGTLLTAETSAVTNRRFTSYDRSTSTGLDYAVNRHFDSQQGRFTQVDPIGMKAVSLEHPQTLNLYAYCGNDPVNHTDPNGLFFGWLKKLFKGVGKIFSAIGNAIARVLNNRWVRIGVFVASLLLPGLGGMLYKIVDMALKIYNRVADIASMLQLSGMLLQGKWKELVVSVGLGYINNAITTVVNNVVKGLVQGVGLGRVLGNHKGFFQTLGDAFKGSWFGLKNGLHQLIGRGWQSLIPIYGNYCGPGVGNGGASDAPINALDGACQAHDSEYFFDQTNRGRLFADMRLFDRFISAVTSVSIGDIVFAGRPSGGNVYRLMGIFGFGGLIAGRGGIEAGKAIGRFFR